MIQIGRTFNIDLIKELVLSEDIYPFLSDDYSISDPDKYEPDVYLYTWLIVYDDHNPVGFFLLQHKDSVICELHMGFTKKCDRKKFSEINDKLIHIMKTKYPYHKILGYIASSNRAALLTAYRFGFKREGYLEEAMLKNGKYRDVIIVGRTL